MNKNDQVISKTSFIALFAVVIGLIAVGTVGYMVIEGWAFLDAIYMVVITLATVGYKEVNPLSPAGTVFTILLIVFGIVTLYYVIRVFGEYILASRLDPDYRNRQMQGKIQNLRDHYLVCGFGRVGEKVVEELTKENVPFVVIEIDPEVIEVCRLKGYLCVVGDATNEDVMLEAGIMSAKGLISTLGRDSDNVLTVITARTINSDLFIVARANTDTAVAKLIRVGANRAVSPYQISAFRMATFALRSGVADFVDSVLDPSSSEVQISDATVGSNSSLVGSSVEKYLANRKSGVTVLVIHRSDGNAIINPLGDTEIQEGDRLILMGTRPNLSNIEKLINH
ncbi:potassium channel protein [Patescibacteria group bacterium]|nr:potassium channel protein [Patescibacteria group bacterium]